MKTKLNTTEKRALALCEAIRQSGGPYPIDVEWKRSATWGLCPSIRHRGGKAAHASGCGYCKLSAVLADALQFITGDPANPANLGSGAGVGSVTDALARLGWDLKWVATGKLYDCYTIRRA